MAGVNNILRGMSVLSPSKKLVAVTNLADGIDWYGIEEHAFLHTMIYGAKEKFIVGLCFLFKSAIIVRHSHGELIITSTVMEINSQHFHFLPDSGSKYRSHVQNVWLISSFRDASGGAYMCLIKANDF